VARNWVTEYDKKEQEGEVDEFWEV